MGSAVGIALLEDLYQTYPNEMVENPRLMKFVGECFLNNQRNNKFETNKRLRKYLIWRRESFGDLDDHSLENNPVLRDQILTGYMSILPQRLPDGTAVVFIRQRFHHPELYNTKQTLQFFHFMLMAAIMKDPTLASCNMVIVNNFAGAEQCNADTNTSMAILNALKSFLPVRLVHMVAVNPPMMMRFIFPIISAFISGIEIAPTSAHLQNILSAPLSSLPTELGGEVVLIPPEDILKSMLNESVVV